MLSPIKWLRRLLTLLAALAIVSLVGLYIADGTFLNAPFWERQTQPVMGQLAAALPDLLAGNGADAANVKPYLQSALTPDYLTVKINQTLEAASEYLHDKSSTAAVDFSDLVPRLAAQGYAVPADQVTQFSQPVDIASALSRPAPIVHSILRWKTWGIAVALVFLVFVFLSAPGHHRWRRLGETAFIAGLLFGLSFVFWEFAPRILIGMVNWGDAKALADPAKQLVGAVGQDVALLNLKAAVIGLVVAGGLFCAHFLHPIVARFLGHGHAHDSGGLQSSNRNSEH